MLKVFRAALDIPDKRTRNHELKDLLFKIRKTAEDLGEGRWINYVSIIAPFCEARMKRMKYHEYVLQAHLENQGMALTG